MNLPTTHLHPLPRRYAAAPAVQSIGYIARKTDTVDHPFKTFNYSFILSGSGFYTWQEKRLEVKAPCVLTQWPDEPMHYGPDTAWEELYFIYHVDQQEELAARGFINPAEPMWYLSSGTILAEKISEMTRLLEQVSQPFMADRIDLLCQSIILESKIHRSPSPLEPGERIIREIENHIRQDVSGTYDFDLIARKHGLHPAKFRRDWNRFIDTPPARYVMNLRMAEAGRLLVETSLPIGEIARKLGFNDELYFSKKFRSAFGTTASVYRRFHQENLSMVGRPENLY